MTMGMWGKKLHLYLKKKLFFLRVTAGNWWNKGGGEGTGINYGKMKKLNLKCEVKNMSG